MEICMHDAAVMVAQTGFVESLILSAPSTVPDRAAPPEKDSAMLHLNATAADDDSPLIWALPGTAPPKRPTTVNVTVGVGVVAVHFREMFPVPPTPATSAILGAVKVPVTSIGAVGMVASVVHVDVTSAVGVLMRFISRSPSVIGLVSGAKVRPTATAVVPVTVLTVQLIADAWTIGDMNWAQLMSGTMSPAPSGSVGSADTGAGATRAATTTAVPVMSARKSFMGRD
jgi:hypothetical protein